jgi:hypothetical protein
MGSSMKVMFVGEGHRAVEEALAGEGFHVLHAPTDELDGPPDTVAEIAAGLRAFETALGGGEVERLVLAGSSNPALAALLVATKMQIPVAAIGDEEAGRTDDAASGVNEQVIESLADETLGDDPAAIAGWLRRSR